MPFVDLESNLPASSFSDEFLKKLSSCTASTLGKPQERMNVVVKPGLPMLIAGSCSPCVMLSVSAISVTDTADKNKEHSAKIFEFLTKELGLTEDRCKAPFGLQVPSNVEIICRVPGIAQLQASRAPLHVSLIQMNVSLTDLDDKQMVIHSFEPSVLWEGNVLNMQNRGPRGLEFGIPPHCSNII